MIQAFDNSLRHPELSDVPAKNTVLREWFAVLVFVALGAAVLWLPQIIHAAGTQPLADTAAVEHKYTGAIVPAMTPAGAKESQPISSPPRSDCTENTISLI